MFVINHNTSMSIIKNVYKRISADYFDARESAECDAKKMIMDNYGKPYPYCIEMSSVTNSINKLTNWKAEIIVFEKEIDRDLHELRKNETYIIFKNHKN